MWAFIKISLYATLFDGINKQEPKYTPATYVVTPFFASGPILGWLADARLGHFKMFKIGNIMCFLASVTYCVCVLLLENEDNGTLLSHILNNGVVVIAYAVELIGVIACLVTAIALGLDQMPHASDTNITSFITWVSFSIFAGMWFSELLIFIPTNCIEEIMETDKMIKQIQSLLPVVCTALSCSSVFLMSKWLVLEPKSPKALKTIYQVLRFAAKHKTPIYRSALTYWEEDIPSRMDLGKSRYGGPFTTEQVEDVKTFFKILAILLPLTIISISSNSSHNCVIIKDLFKINQTTSYCASSLTFIFGYSHWTIALIATITYEFVIYGFIKNRLPSIMKRIGCTSLAILIVNTVHIIVGLMAELNYDINTKWLAITSCTFVGVAQFCLATGLLEFVCAQSPYKMRGLLTGTGIFSFLASVCTGSLLNSLFRNHTICNKQNCFLIQSCLSGALSLVGFVFYCLLARWYKRRVRDEEYDVHRGVEEVYDRYLSSPQRLNTPKKNTLIK